MPFPEIQIPFHSLFHIGKDEEPWNEKDSYNLLCYQYNKIKYD